MTSAPLKGWLRENLYVVFDGSVIEVFATDYAPGDTSGPRSASARRSLDVIADLTLDGERLWWVPVREPHPGLDKLLFADAIHPDCLPFAEALVAAVRQAKAR